MNEADQRISNLFTKGSHHTDSSVIHIVQNLFSKNKEHMWAGGNWPEYYL